MSGISMSARSAPSFKQSVRTCQSGGWCYHPNMIGMLFSLMFMMIRLTFQVLVWTIRLMFMMIKLMFELIEGMAATRR